MWPRHEEELQRRRMSGFVCFMEREHAAAAIRELQSYDLDGNRILVGWGKRVPLPPKPLPMPHQVQNRDASVPAPELTYSLPKDARLIHVAIPDADSKKRIDVVAKYVANFGLAFEVSFPRNEFKLQCSTYAYCRTKLKRSLVGIQAMPSCQAQWRILNDYIICGESIRFAREIRLKDGIALRSGCYKEVDSWFHRNHR